MADSSSPSYRARTVRGVETDGEPAEAKDRPVVSVRAEVAPELPFLATDPGPASAISSPAPQEPAGPIEHWDRYEFLGLLGAGGMGSVYRARDRQLGRIVALKFIRGDNPALHQRFLQEAQAQARLDHPNLCRIHEVGRVAGRPYIAMQFIDGLPLDALREDLNLHEKIQIIRDAALALNEAHRLGIVHRDIKPSNIMVERQADGSLRPVVMDFGLAHDASAHTHLTETGAVMGTPAFMSPEQARGNSRHLDRRADVYSLGATLYELLTGRPPFVGEQVVDIILAVLGNPPQSPRVFVPELPVDLETITLRCLEKDPIRRYDSARALADDLQRHLDGVPIVARPPSLGYRLRRLFRRHRGLVSLGIAAGLVILLLLGSGARMELRARGQARLAQELGQDIKEIELFLRAAYSLPLHDIRREQAVVRQRMAALSAKLRGADAAAAAALHYALGRGHLMLRQYEEAQVSLEQAWEAGYKTSEARMALGLALGERYRQEIERAQRSGDKRWIEARERELSQRYLQPALTYLGGAVSGIETPTYIKGLLAFYRRQDDMALGLSQRAQADAPWLAEPIKLEGDVYQTRGIELLDRGMIREGRAMLARAAERHHASAQINRSDSRIYEAEAVDWIRIMEADTDTGDKLAEGQAGALQATAHVIAADPQSSSGFQLRAWAYWRVGVSKQQLGQDAEPDFNDAVALAEKATSLNPEDWQSYYFYALALAGTADMREARGQDTTELNDRAITALNKSIRFNGNFPWAWNDLGLQHLALFKKGNFKGVYRREQFSSAESAFLAAARQDPGYANPHFGLTALYIENLDYMAQYGQDFEGVTAQARQAALQSAAVRSDDPAVCRNTLAVELQFLEHLISSTQEPKFDQIAEIGRMLSLCREKNPNDGLLDHPSARLALLSAQNEVLAQRTPLRAIEQGLQIVAEGSARDPQSYPLAVLKARLLTLSGRMANAASDAQRTFAQAIAAAEQASALHPDLAEAHELLGEVLHAASRGPDHRTNGAWEKTAAHAKWTARGLQACDASLAINPTRAMAHAHRGALLLLKAQREGAETRQARAAQAVQSLTRALAINHWLRRSVAPLLKEAELLAADRLRPGQAATGSP